MILDRERLASNGYETRRSCPGGEEIPPVSLASKKIFVSSELLGTSLVSEGVSKSGKGISKSSEA